MTFLSNVRGRPVFDAEGSRVGTVADLLVSPEIPYPPVDSVMVRSRRADYAVPWSEVAAVAPTGTSLRATFDPSSNFTPDAGLVWLGRDILDKQIVDTQGVKLVRVNDIVLTNLNDELRVAGVDGSTTGLLRRLGLGRLSKRRPPLIDWEQVDIGPAVREVRLKVPFAGLRRMHPADIAHIATQMSPGEAADVFEELDDETAAKAIAELPDDRQATVLAAMDPDEAADVLDEMDPDEAADVLGDIGKERADALMALMDPLAARRVRSLLRYPERTAGGLMTTSFVLVTKGELVADGLAAVRSAAGRGDDVDSVYVADREGGLLGRVALSALIAADPHAQIETAMGDDFRTVFADEPDEDVARMLVYYALVTIPVVDEFRKLLGVINISDAIDLFAPRAWRTRPRLNGA